jgi:hypothetical protein
MMAEEYESKVNKIFDSLGFENNYESRFYYELAKFARYKSRKKRFEDLSLKIENSYLISEKEIVHDEKF